MKKVQIPPKPPDEHFINIKVTFVEVKFDLKVYIFYPINCIIEQLPYLSSYELIFNQQPLDKNKSFLEHNLPNNASLEIKPSPEIKPLPKFKLNMINKPKPKLKTETKYTYIKISFQRCIHGFYF